MKDVRLVLEVCDMRMAYGLFLGMDGMNVPFTCHNNLLEGLRNGEQAGWAQPPGEKEKEVGRGWGQAMGIDKARDQIRKTLVLEYQVEDKVKLPDRIWKENASFVASDLYCA